MTVSAACGPPRPVRLTRRGRIVVLLLLVFAAVGAAALAASPGEAAAPAAPRATVVVRPGDTLWSIAASAGRRHDPFEVIDEIRELNGISDYTVQPGERLILPRAR